MSKIANVEIPNGHSIETKGICIKYLEETGLCLLDSVGFDTPLLENEITNHKENSENSENKNKEDNEKNEFDKMIKYDQKEDILSKDKMQTERFIENLIISLSDMLILVIGKLTRTEQRLITRIKNMANDNENKIKSIIIVHNLAQYNKKIEVERHINEFLLKSATFKIIKKKVLGINDYTDRFYYVEKFDNKNNNIEVFHYLMAKEGTEAGDYYNELTMQLIKQQYNNSNQRKAIDIPKQIKKLFCDLSDEIIGEKIKEDQIETIGEKTIKFKDNKDNNKRNENSDFQIQNAYIDQDGNYLRNKGKYEPKYSLYVYREGEGEDDDEYENYLLLRIEIPGNIIRLTARSTNPKEDRYTGIILKGIKEEDEIPEKNKKDFKTIRDTRIYDEINFFIELKGKLALHKKITNM